MAKHESKNKFFTTLSIQWPHIEDNCSDPVETATYTSPDRALIGPSPKMSWVKKVFFNEGSES